MLLAFEIYVGRGCTLVCKSLTCLVYWMWLVVVCFSYLCCLPPPLPHPFSWCKNSHHSFRGKLPHEMSNGTEAEHSSEWLVLNTSVSCTSSAGPWLCLMWISWLNNHLRHDLAENSPRELPPGYSEVLVYAIASFSAGSVINEIVVHHFWQRGADNSGCQRALGKWAPLER